MLSPAERPKNEELEALKGSRVHAKAGYVEE